MYKSKAALYGLQSVGKLKLKSDNFNVVIISFQILDHIQ